MVKEISKDEYRNFIKTFVAWIQDQEDVRDLFAPWIKQELESIKTRDVGVNSVSLELRSSDAVRINVRFGEHQRYGESIVREDTSVWRPVNFRATLNWAAYGESTIEFTDEFINLLNRALKLSKDFEEKFGEEMLVCVRSVEESQELQRKREIEAHSTKQRGLVTDAVRAVGSIRIGTVKRIACQAEAGTYEITLKAGSYMKFKIFKVLVNEGQAFVTRLA